MTETAMAARTMAGAASGAEPSLFASIVVLVSEGKRDLAEIYREFAPPLLASGRSFEFLFVLEPWHEAAARALNELAAGGAPVRVLIAGQALGEASLLRAAAPHCHGEIVVTLPSYPRVEPSSLPLLLDRAASGVDVVAAVRSPRRDPWINRLQSRVFHWLLRPTSGGRFHDLGCGVHAIHRPVLEQLPLYGDFLRFLPILTAREGYRTDELSVPQHHLDQGTRVYWPGTYLRRLVDILGLYFLVRFTEKPLRFFGLLGSAGLLTGGAVLLVLLVQRLQGKGIADRPLLLLGVLLVVLGVQAIALGLVGEIIVHLGSTHRRAYRLARPLPAEPAGRR